jgi:NTE family protein
MPPVPWEGKVLMDGGIIDPVPCRPAKEEGAEIVIGVDVGQCICRLRPVEDGIDEIQRAIDIMGFHMNKQSTECAHVVIEPDVKGIEWTDFAKYKELIRKGEEAAEREMNKIRRILPSGFPKRLFQRASGVIGGAGRGWFAGKFSKSGGKTAVSANSAPVGTG